MNARLQKRIDQLGPFTPHLALSVGMASGSFDSLPHNGAVIPVVALVVVIALGTVFGRF